VRLSLGAYAIAPGKPRLGVLGRQIIEDPAGLGQKPTIVFLEGRHGTRGIYGEKLIGAKLHLDGLVWCADPFKSDVWGQRAGANGIVECGHFFVLLFKT
jgi:hypothetical protein